MAIEMVIFLRKPQLSTDLRHAFRVFRGGERRRESDLPSRFNHVQFSEETARKSWKTDLQIVGLISLIDVLSGFCDR